MRKAHVTGLFFLCNTFNFEFILLFQDTETLEQESFPGFNLILEQFHISTQILTLIIKLIFVAQALSLASRITCKKDQGSVF